MSQATRILLSLVAGLVIGIAFVAWSPAVADTAVAVARPVGTAWLNALQMTVVPLIVALVITGVATTAAAAGAGRITARAIATFVGTLIVTCGTAALVTPLLLALFPVPATAAAALRGALNGVGGGAAVPDTPPPALGEMFAAIVPTNVVASAANGAFLSLIVFTLAFAFAVTRLEPEQRERIVGFFAAVRDAMLVLIGWVLWLAPIGVFALALVVGARTGTAAVAALLHYILVVSSVGCVVIALGFVVAWVGGRATPLAFERAALPAHAVAISTQSSLASLPAMLTGAAKLGVPVATAGVVLPLAVTMFRATQPAMNIGIAIYIAHWFAVPTSAVTIASAGLVAILLSLGSVSLPAQITFFASIAPVCVALGVPVAPLGLLIAVETIPDIFRTLGNVTMDLAATLTVSIRGGAVLPTEADRLLKDSS